MDECSNYGVLSNAEYRLLRNTAVACTACRLRCSAISWDRDPPHSICCKAPITVAKNARLIYKGEIVPTQ